jgi:hypothetical protein
VPDCPRQTSAPQSSGCLYLEQDKIPQSAAWEAATAKNGSQETDFEERHCGKVSLPSDKVCEEGNEALLESSNRSLKGPNVCQERREDWLESSDVSQQSAEVSLERDDICEGSDEVCQIKGNLSLRSRHVCEEKDEVRQPRRFVSHQSRIVSDRHIFKPSLRCLCRIRAPISSNKKQQITKRDRIRD